MAEDSEAVVPTPVLHARIPEEALLEGSHGQQRVTNGVSRCCPGKDSCSVSTLRDSERVHFLQIDCVARRFMSL